jgi:hypothetical protein
MKNILNLKGITLFDLIYTWKKPFISECLFLYLRKIRIHQTIQQKLHKIEEYT